MHIGVRETGRSIRRSSRADRGESVKMSVDAYQLLIIMCIRMLIAGRPVGIAGVVHTGTQVWIVEVLVLVIEAKIMSNLLTHHQATPGGSVVLSLVEIRIIHFGDSLGDMRTARGPNLSYA